MLTLDDRPDHPYLASSYAPRRPPSPDIQEFGSGIAGREAGDMGHDGIDQYQATRKIIAAAGLDPDVWGFCPACRGEGWVERYPGQNADAEAWEPTGPPTGDGWQLWETVSEGSPISPVFPDKTGLVEWLCSPAYTWGGPMSRDTAERFVDFGWAPSFVFTPGRGLQTGEEFVGETT
jgi:hypothetical protein